MRIKPTAILAVLKKKYRVQLAEAKRALDEDYYNGRPKVRAKLSGPRLEPNLYLFQKWAYRVGKGWYGFSLGPIPDAWTNLLDKFLVWLESQCPDFQIHQIKTKFGRLCLYIETNCPDAKMKAMVAAEIAKLERLMFHENLIFGRRRHGRRVKPCQPK